MKRKELLILVFLASVCIRIILFLLNAIQLWSHVEKTVTTTVSSMRGKNCLDNSCQPRGEIVVLTHLFLFQLNAHTCI